MKPPLHLMRKKVDSAELIAELKTANEDPKNCQTCLRDSAQAAQNELSRLFGQYKKEGKNTDELKIEVDAATNAA